MLFLACHSASDRGIMDYGTEGVCTDARFSHLGYIVLEGIYPLTKAWIVQPAVCCRRQWTSKQKDTGPRAEDDTPPMED